MKLNGDRETGRQLRRRSTTRCLPLHRSRSLNAHHDILTSSGTPSSIGDTVDNPLATAVYHSEEARRVTSTGSNHTSAYTALLCPLPEHPRDKHQTGGHCSWLCPGSRHTNAQTNTITNPTSTTTTTTLDTILSDYHHAASMQEDGTEQVAVLGTTWKNTATIDNCRRREMEIELEQRLTGRVKGIYALLLWRDTLHPPLRM